MSRVTGMMGNWVAGAAVVLALAGGCTNTVQPVRQGPPNTTFASGAGGSVGGPGGGRPALPGGQGGIGTCGAVPDAGAQGGASFVMPILSTPVSPSTPMLDAAVVSADTPPPAISGGTLLMLSDGITAVAADADRDQLYVVNVATGTLGATVALSPGDQPGRLVEDGAGRVHVVLRGAGALATLDPVAGQVTMRRAVCTTPRGIAYGPTSGMLYLACASGQLMVFTPTGTAPSKTWTLDQDLRDVIIDGDGLLVTRFRSAEVLEVDPATGAITGRQHPPAFSNPTIRQGASFESVVAWRAAAVPGGGMVMAHQRGTYDRVFPSPGGYGSSGVKDPCGNIVHSCISKMKRGGMAAAGPAFPEFVLPVDLAVSPQGDKVAVVAAGNSHAPFGTARGLFVGGTDDVTADYFAGCGNDDQHGPATFATCFNTATGGTAPQMGGSGGVGGSMSATVTTGGGSGGVTDAPPTSSGIVGFCGPDPLGGQQPVSVAFADERTVLVQTREPATLLILRGLGSLALDKVVVPLSSVSREDTGHTLFHANSGGGLACASCHPEGHDDGRVWSFDCEGQRRTQDPSGGLLATAPYHWNGDLATFPKLVQEVFVRRMSGPTLTDEQMTALQSWVGRLPGLPPLRAADDAQVAHGKTLFESPSVGCATCHAGATFTNNMTTDVGTGNGASFQVPSLRGVGWRAPYMHDGCAATLSDRFTDAACGGGDRHGVTSGLSDADRADLIAYLQSL